MLPQVVTYLPGLRPLSTMELYTDTYYIQRIQAGDVACFACLLDKYSRPIHSLILKVVRSQEEAEELAQDTFIGGGGYEPVRTNRIHGTGSKIGSRP